MICPMYGEMAEEKAQARVHEPVGMNRDELLEWYLSQPTPFRRKNMNRITSLTQALLAAAIMDAVAEAYPIGVSDVAH